MIKLGIKTFIKEAVRECMNEFFGTQTMTQTQAQTTSESLDAAGVLVFLNARWRCPTARSIRTVCSYVIRSYVSSA